jgi:hypothetical protein
MVFGFGEKSRYCTDGRTKLVFGQRLGQLGVTRVVEAELVQGFINSLVYVMIVCCEAAHSQL